MNTIIKLIIEKNNKKRKVKNKPYTRRYYVSNT